MKTSCANDWCNFLQLSLVQSKFLSAVNQKMLSSGLETCPNFHGWGNLRRSDADADARCTREKIGRGHFERKSTLVWIIKTLFMKKVFAVFTFYKFQTLLFLTVMADKHRVAPTPTHAHAQAHTHTHTHAHKYKYAHTRAKKIFAIENYYFYSFISWCTRRERKSEEGSFPGIEPFDARPWFSLRWSLRGHVSHFP